MTTEVKTCKGCGRTLPADRTFFYGGRGRLTARCKRCLLESQRAWQISRRVSGIYQIRHLSSGRVYVGSAVCIRHRWSQHRSELRRGTHGNSYLQHAWSAYGEQAFAFEVLETGLPERLLIAVEQAWINHLGALSTQFGYNISPIAGRNPAPRLPANHAEQTRARNRARASAFIVTFPDGSEEVTNHLNDFCAKHGLNSVQMRLAAKAQVKGHKGYRCRLAGTTLADWQALRDQHLGELEDKKIKYVMTFPDGREEVFTNASAQARKIGVSVGSIHSLIGGRALRIHGHAVRRTDLTQQESDARTGRGKSTSSFKKYIMTFPDGREEEFTNASAQARKIGVATGSIHSLIQARVLRIRGHAVRPVEFTQKEWDEKTGRAYSSSSYRQYVIKGENGETIRFGNIRKTAKELGITYSRLHDLVNKKIECYKGYAAID